MQRTISAGLPDSSAVDLSATLDGHKLCITHPAWEWDELHPCTGTQSQSRPLQAHWSTYGNNEHTAARCAAGVMLWCAQGTAMRLQDAHAQTFMLLVQTKLSSPQVTQVSCGSLATRPCQAPSAKLPSAIDTLLHWAHHWCRLQRKDNHTCMRSQTTCPTKVALQHCQPIRPCADTAQAQTNKVLAC